MSLLRALRPAHWLGAGLVVAVIATGAWTSLFGVFGGNSSEAKRVVSCLEHHGVNVASLALGIGDPTTFLNGARALDREIHAASRQGKLKSGKDEAVMKCLARLSQ